MKILERLPSVKRRTGIGETSIRERIAAGQFPRPLKLGSAPNSPLAWPAEEIDRWIELQVQKSRCQPHSPSDSEDPVAATLASMDAADRAA